MPREQKTTLYKYAELSADAQAKARDWWRSMENASPDIYFSESVTDDFKEVLKAAGFDLDKRHGRDALYWSGFSHQGAGACFGASWSASDVSVDAMLADRPATYERDGETHTCPHNAKLRPLLERAADLASQYPGAVGSLSANDRYMSTRLESATASDESDAEQDTDLGESLQELASDLAAFYYRALESEYEYTMADEQVAETIVANEYEFTVDGDFWR